MKTDLNNVFSQYKRPQANPVLKNGKEAIAAAKDLPEKALPTIKGQDYRVELSGNKPSSLPSLPDLPTPSLPSVSAPSTPSVPDVPKEAKEVIEEVAKKEIKIEKEVKEGTVKKPLIVFMKGLDVFSSPSKSERGYAGVGRMAEAVEGARIYGYDQKSEVVNEILKTHRDYPVILVGHSFGGDSAVDIANELDSVKHNFRKIDLLVTIDAIGFNNDIIPQNVKQHLNVFGEKDLILNDGPHVARREENTNVRNILSPLAHTDIDDDKEVQFEVMSLIQETLSKSSPSFA